MENFDPVSAARVWQRVQGARPVQPPADRHLTELIAREWMDAAIYQQLSRRFQGKEGAVLRRLFEEEQAHAACLKGIYTLITGERPQVKAVQPEQENTEVLLRRCYGREMQSLAQYEARSEDPEYGPVFARLAQQEREHCRLVLELIGSMKRK